MDLGHKMKANYFRYICIILIVLIVVFLGCVADTSYKASDIVDVNVQEGGAFAYVKHGDIIIKLIFDDPDIDHMACPPNTTLTILISKKVNNEYHDYEGYYIY